VFVVPRFRAPIAHRPFIQSPRQAVFCCSKNGQGFTGCAEVAISSQPEKLEIPDGGMRSKTIAGIPQSDLEKTLYSMAISFCASIDLLKKGDQQTPGTFFGKFVAFFFAAQLGVEPLHYVRLMNYDEPGIITKLQTDLIFDLGKKKQKFHVPVKTSTRERAIMLWAHQKLVDGAYGVGRFMGTPVLLAETKTDAEKKEVVEICLADQWRVYQLYISRLKRIYYLDLPEAYRLLNSEFPPIHVKPFAEFFLEWKDLMPS
jgi:hypothetical protein